MIFVALLRNHSVKNSSEEFPEGWKSLLLLLVNFQKAGIL